MLQELISKATKISETTNAKFEGALVQVTQELSIDDIGALAEEMDSSTLKKNAQRTRDGAEFFNINGLRNDAYKSINSYVTKQRLIAERAEWAKNNK